MEQNNDAIKFSRLYSLHVIVFTDKLQIHIVINNYKLEVLLANISQNENLKSSFNNTIDMREDRDHHLLAGSIMTQLELFDCTQLDGTH